MIFLPHFLDLRKSTIQCVRDVTRMIKLPLSMIGHFVSVDSLGATSAGLDETTRMNKVFLNRFLFFFVA